MLYGYGEERYARRIAQKIVEERAQNTIETTKNLVEIIESAVPSSYRHGKLHPATRSFQALRIATNDELEALGELIEKAITLLAPGGRLAIISFHSIEDRIVKRLFREKAHESLGTILTKKPIVPTDAELNQNPRSRSAKLRVFEKK